jgi:sarcosine oxidase subunit beta
MAPGKAEVIVIGGGVIGTSVAYYASRRGYKVTLLEKEHISSGASGACGGTVFMQTKNLGRHLELALKSAALYRNLAEELDFDIEYSVCGGMIAIENEQQAPIVQHTVEQQRLAGLAVDILDIKEARELEPMLGEHLCGATFCAADAIVNPFRVNRAFCRAAGRLGANLRIGVNVIDLVVENGRVRGVLTGDGPIYSDCVVNAAAIWAPALTKKYGYEPPITPHRGQVLITERLLPGTLRHILLCGCYLTAKHYPELLDMKERQHRLAAGLILEQGTTGGLVIGSTRELVGVDRTTTLDGIEVVAEHLYRVMPRLGPVNVIRAFAGLRPRTPNGMPILGAVESLPGLIMAAGHGGDGISLAPITGQLIADCVATMN